MSPETPLESVFEEPPPTKRPGTGSLRGQRHLPPIIPQPRGKRKRGQERERNEHDRTDPLPEARKPESFTRSSSCRARLLASAPLLNRGQTNVLFWQKKRFLMAPTLYPHRGSRCPFDGLRSLCVPSPCTNPTPCAPGYRRLDVPLSRPRRKCRAEHHTLSLPDASQPRLHQGKEPLTGPRSKVRREGRSDSFPSLRIPCDRVVKPHGRQDIQLRQLPPRSFGRSQPLQIKALA